MSNKFGSVDRRMPVKPLMVSVRKELDRYYPEYLPMDSRDSFELDAFCKAQERLSEEDRAYIESQQRKVDRKRYMAKSRDSINIRGFGSLAMLEVLAKLGIFLNAANK